jgi:hypothetical protein
MNRFKIVLYVVIALSAIVICYEGIRVLAGDEIGMPGFFKKPLSLNDIRFGCTRDSMILGQIFSLEKPDSIYWKIQQEMSREAHKGNKRVVPFPDEFIKRYLHQKRGNKITILSSRGKYKAIITELGNIYNGNVEMPFCLLRPAGFKLAQADSNQPFIMLPRGYSYKGPIIRFSEYISADPAVLSMFKDIRHDAILWKNACTPLEPGQTRGEESVRLTVRAFAPDGNNIPDTLLVLAGFNHSLLIFSYTVVYQAVQIDGQWVFSNLSEATFGPAKDRIDCAFDLNHDHVLEYLLVSQSQLCWAIYTTIDNKFKRVSESGTFASENYRF